jgi:serine/threonine protein kinase
MKGKPAMEGGGADQDLFRVLEELEEAADRLRIPPIGALVDARYRVIENIGYGTTGWVFGVRHQFLDQCFAMKILHPRIASDPAWIARFREEARATSLIAHENIVFVTDFGYCKTFGHYLVMEYLDGLGLDAILAERALLPFDLILRFALAAGSALQAVHNLGIVYSNLNPRNIMMLPGEATTETWKLLDFSTASFRTEVASAQVEFGSPAYISPEQAAGQHLDPRSDVFSLGAVLYEMFTGRPPWAVTSRGGATREARQIPPEPPSGISSTAPKELDKIVLRALELDPEHRWKSVHEFIGALDAAVRTSLEMDTEPLTPFASPSVTLLENDKPHLGFRWLDQTSLHVTFSSAHRFVREYQKNLSEGRLFVPSERPVEFDDKLTIQVRYEPTEQEIEVRAAVVSHPKKDIGFGLLIDVEDRPGLDDFIRSLQLGLGLLQDDVLRPLVELDQQGDLAVGEAFLLSRVNRPTRVGVARSLCAGLPFDFESAVSGLVQKGQFALTQASTGTWRAISRTESESSLQAAPMTSSDEPAHPALAMNATDVEKTLALVDSFRAKKNYLSAIDVLRKALGLSPEVAEFYYQLALLYAQFTNDLPRAFQSLYNAIRLEPTNGVYRDTLEVFERMKF